MPKGVSRDEAEAHFAKMPLDYWRNVNTVEVRWHLAVMHRFFEHLSGEAGEGISPVVDWQRRDERSCFRVAVCAWDCAGLFAAISGAMAAVELNVCKAFVYTRSDDLALDVFCVNRSERAKGAVEPALREMTRLLTRALNGKETFSFESQKGKEPGARAPGQRTPKETYMAWNNRDSAHHNILHVEIPDRQGLLYHVADEVTTAGLDVVTGLFRTTKGRFGGELHVTRRSGSKVQDELYLEGIRKRLFSRLGRVTAE